MKKRRNAARRFVQNGVKKYIFNRQKEGENYFLKRRRNHWPIDFLDLKKDVKLSKIHNKYRNTEIQKYRNTKKSRLFSTGLSYKRCLVVTAI